MTLHLGLRGTGHQSRVTASATEPDLPSNAETAALLARFETDPGPERRALIDNLVGSLKAAGVWAKLDVLYLLAAHDAQAARLNWIQETYDAALSGTTTFTADRGVNGDGVDGHIDTGFNDLTGSALWSQDSMSAGVYVNQYAGGSTWFLGLATAQSLRVGLTGSGIATRIHSTLSFNPSFTDAVPGHIAVVREGATTSLCYRNAVQVGIVSPHASTASPDSNVTVSRSGNNYHADRVAAVHLGGALTASEVSDLHDAIMTYLTALGAA